MLNLNHLHLLTLAAFAAAIILAEPPTPQQQLIDCEKNQSFPDHKFPVSNAAFGANYEITLRTTNRLTNETAKIWERNFGGDTLVVHKWTRKMEMAWYNRSVLFQDHFTKPDPHHLLHNRTCRAINATGNPEELNALSLSAQLLQALQLDGASFDQLLARLASVQQNYNATLYTVPPVMGVEAVGWLGCVRNISGKGQNLQLNVRWAGEMTPEEPYNPYWANPLVYSTDLVFYEGTGSNLTLLDSLTFDVVTLDRVHPADREFAITPPRGVHCEKMNATALPMQFPPQFLAQISSTTRKSEQQEDMFTTNQHKLFYDAVTRIVAYNPEMFSQSDRDLMGSSSAPDRIIHDFTYGFQYTIAPNGTCKSIAGIDPNAPDVAVLPNGTEKLLFMLHPEEMLIWHGKRERMAANAFYYAGKIKSTDTGEPLAIFSTIRPTKREQFEQHFQQPKQVADEGNQLVEVLFTVDAHGKAAQFHSISTFNGTQGGEAGRLETQRIQLEMGTENEELFSAWNALNLAIRPCILLMGAANENGKNVDSTLGNRTGVMDGNFYVRLANVTLAQLERTIGHSQLLGAVAETISLAANVSQLRIVDLELKQMKLQNDQEVQVESSQLVALFSIGLPTGTAAAGVKPAKTAYLKDELTVEQAAQALNDSVRLGHFQVHIPQEQHKKNLNITANAFGAQSELFPYPPAPFPPTPPTPSFVGYSGSALAICACFAFILGVGLVVGSYVFYQKRQHIRGFAYQVFE